MIGSGKAFVKDKRSGLISLPEKKLEDVRVLPSETIETEVDLLQVYPVSNL
jgi:hypothetical protein